MTIGLSWFIVWMVSRYAKTGDDGFRKLARFWIRVFTATFVVGAATGIALEFQFGTNWADYSRYVGDVFGPALAIESIVAFFLESTFLAVLALGWDRVSPRMLRFAAIMVAVGSTLSALWILAANSWQQTPAGYHIVNGRAELTSFWQAVANPSTLPRFLHTVNACLMTGAFFVLGASVWFVIKGRSVDLARAPLRAALIVALITSILQAPLGHYHAVQVALTQPEKLAAYEGLFETQAQAPLLVFGVPRPDSGETRPAIRIPGGLSLLVHGSVDGVVQGLNDFPREDWPPLALTFYPFHLMVGIGLYLIAFSALGLLLLRLGSIGSNRLFMRLALVTALLPFVANELGWIATEAGRQPWVVYHVLRTSDAVSRSVPAGQVLFTTIAFFAIYALVFAAWVAVLRRQFDRGFEQDEAGGYE